MNNFRYLIAAISCFIYLVLYSFVKVLLFKNTDNSEIGIIDGLIFVFIPCSFIWQTIITKLRTKKEENIEENNIINDINIQEIYNYFTKGKDKFTYENEYKDALFYFDKAVENEFDKHFKSEAKDLFNMRAFCLQQLKYQYEAIENFEKAIKLDPNNCNLFYACSFSRAGILDYEGAIQDLEQAVEISKIYTDLNKEYNLAAKEQGYPSLTSMYELYLSNAKADLKSDSNRLDRIANARSEELKESLLKNYNHFRNIMLDRVLLRESKS